MSFKDLKDFLGELEDLGELRRIGVPVDTIFEVTEITNRVVKLGGPALLFEKPKGFSIPLLTNLLGTERRMSLALRAGNFDEVLQRVEGFLDLFSKPGTGGVIGKIKGLYKVKELSGFLPKVEKKGEFERTVLDGGSASFNVLPIPKFWPEDGGRFITCPVVVVKRPDGTHNLGMYRMQVFEERVAGMHWQIHKDGRRIAGSMESGRIPVAVVLGADPLFIYLAVSPVPEGIGDYLFGGVISGESLSLVKTRKYGIEVPSSSEIVLEGYVDLTDIRVEGPFGDHTGYYTPPSEYPTFHLEAIYMRENPIFPAIVVGGKPPMEDAYFGKVTERIFLPITKRIFPEIVDWCFPVEGGFHNFLFVSIKKRFPGHAFKVIHGLWGLSGVFLTKNIVVFDEDVDVQSISEVIWAWGNNADPARDVILSKGPLDVLDHSSDLEGLGGKMGIDATAKWPSEGFSRVWPKRAEMSPEIKELVDRRWREYGL